MTQRVHGLHMRRGWRAREGCRSESGRVSASFRIRVRVDDGGRLPLSVVRWFRRREQRGRQRRNARQTSGHVAAIFTVVVRCGPFPSVDCRCRKHQRPRSHRAVPFGTMRFRNRSLLRRRRLDRLRASSECRKVHDRLPPLLRQRKLQRRPNVLLRLRRNRRALVLPNEVRRPEQAHRLRSVHRSPALPNRNEVHGSLGKRPSVLREAVIQ
jgi:hypothetical protein